MTERMGDGAKEDASAGMRMKTGLGLSRAAMSIWGKTDRQDGQSWLPLYVHMADSLAMAERIWDHWSPAFLYFPETSRFARSMEL